MPLNENDENEDEDSDFDCDIDCCIDCVFDWTIYTDVRVMGCLASKHSTFAEFRHLNPDRTDTRYNTTNGMYKNNDRNNVGLEHVLLSWTGTDYMHNMLKHIN